MAKILLIDRRSPSREYAALWLQRAGHVVEKSDTSIGWGPRILKEQYALIVIDPDLADVDGFTFLQGIRKFPKTKNIPVLIWTSKLLDRTAQRRASQLGVKQIIVHQTNCKNHEVKDANELLKYVRRYVGDDPLPEAQTILSQATLLRPLQLVKTIPPMSEGTETKISKPGVQERLREAMQNEPNVHVTAEQSVKSPGNLIAEVEDEASAKGPFIGVSKVALTTSVPRGATDDDVLEALWVLSARASVLQRRLSNRGLVIASIELKLTMKFPPSTAP